MSLHGLAEMTLGVPNVDATQQFYREFGLTESAKGAFASADGGDQLRVADGWWSSPLPPTTATTSIASAAPPVLATSP
jgi:catechol 2,3-dioxygenase-like lactoylglutathione lyase family enzyme